MKPRLLLYLCLAMIALALITFRPTETRQSTATIAEKTPHAISKPIVVTETPSEFGTLTSELMGALKRAVAGQNEEQRKEALVSLLRYIREHPEEFDRVASFVAGDALLASNIGVLTDAALSSGMEEANRFFRSAALTIVREQKEAEIRLAALSAVGRTLDGDAQDLPMLTRLALDDTDGQVRQSSVAIMGEWMSRASDPAVRDAGSEELISIIGSSDNSDVRAQAVEVLARNNPNLPAKILDVLLNYLQTVPTPQSRMLVARAVGTETEMARAFAVDQFRQACTESDDLELKRQLLFEIVRVANYGATQVLVQLSESDPPLARDTQDYLALLQSGVTDVDQIQEIKGAWDAERAASVAAKETNQLPVQ